MIYQTVSIQEVIARVVRNTGVQDSRYILAMDEWIPEALGQMAIRQATSKWWEDIYITFHKGKMPCDLHSIEAIEYNGQNLLPSNSLKMVGAAMPAFNKYSRVVSSSQFTSMPQTYQVDHGDGTTGRLYDSSAQPQSFCTQASADCQKLIRCHGEWYQVEVPGYITTSFKCGWIRVHYKRIPCDEDGLPLIPDNENLKHAIYWYCRGMMQGAGWEDPVYRSIEQLLGPQGKFEFHAGRAISEITYPTLGEMELAVRNLNKMIKDENYYDRFFETPDNCRRDSDLHEITYSNSDRVVPNMPSPDILLDMPGLRTIVGETPQGLINSSNKTFITAFTIIPTTLQVWVNGLLQQPFVHYSIGPGLQSIVFVDAPQAPPDTVIPDNILVNYQSTQ